MDNIFYDRFYRHEELSAFLCQLKEEYSDLVTIDNLTESPEGRPIHVVTITDPATGLPETKPAYYVQAGLHAQEGAGTTAALHLINTLISDNHEMLKKITFYIIPRVNPDGTEYALTTRGRIRSRFKKKDVKNGLFPEDINGDGYILSMRWQDPAGPMKEDKEDPRLMIKRQAGDQEGPFYQVMTEGLIQDYDGSEIIDGFDQIDFNRNWPCNWQANPDSPTYPFSEPEVKAVGDFLLDHPNIFAGIDFHCGNNAILKPTIPPGKATVGDSDRIREIGKLAETITGFPLMAQGEDYRDSWSTESVEIAPTLNNWAYYHLGISFYIIELGNGFNNAGITPKEYFNTKPEIRETDFMRRVLAFHDQHNSPIFKQWEKVSHPQLGEIEVGGLLNGCGYYMLPSVMRDIAPKTTAFILQHAQMHPQIVLSELTVEEVGQNIFRIRATIENTGDFSTSIMSSGYVKRPAKVMLRLPEKSQLLSRIESFELDNLTETRKSFEWFVKSEKNTQLTLKIAHPKAGQIIKNINL